MKTNYKTIQIIEMYNALEQFIEKDNILPVNLAWIIDDNYEELKKVVLKFDNYREKLLKPFNQNNAFEVNNENVVVKSEYLDEFTKVTDDINSVLSIENEIEIKTARREDVPSQISSKDLRAIKFMIE